MPQIRTSAWLVLPVLLPLGQMLHDDAPLAGATWNEQEPRFVNVADPVIDFYLGPGRSGPVNGCRYLERSATLRIAAPRGAAENLCVGIFETRDVRPRVRGNGAEAR